MCGSIVDMQYAMAEKRRGKKERRKIKRRNHMMKI